MIRESISQYWEKIQGQLFPFLKEELGPLTARQKQLIAILEVVRIEEFISGDNQQWTGRPLSDRRAIARAFIAKAVYNFTITKGLIDHLQSDKNLRRICGWEERHNIPSESTFSRAFAFFAETELPMRVHEEFIKIIYQGEIVGQVSKDATAIEAREKPKQKEDKATQNTTEEKKKGRPKKGEERPAPEPTRIQKQLEMTLPEMLKDLPKDCDRGVKKNSKGYTEAWNGYKLHLDTSDNGVPLSAILTSASTHDSQVAIPLITITAQRVESLYDLMDSAYDSIEIKEYSKKFNHVPIIDVNPRQNGVKEVEAENKARRTINWKPAEDVRYNGRSVAERTNGRLKDEFGGRMVRVKGHAKVFCHLMFGVLVLAADQVIKIAL